MFGGVTASSMPTVSQFFNRGGFSVPSWALDLKTSFTHLVNRSQQLRISDLEPCPTVWAEGGVKPSDHSKDIDLRDLESGNGNLKEEALPQMDSQIHLTHEIYQTSGR